MVALIAFSTQISKSQTSVSIISNVQESETVITVFDGEGQGCVSGAAEIFFGFEVATTADDSESVADESPAV